MIFQDRPGVSKRQGLVGGLPERASRQLRPNAAPESSQTEGKRRRQPAMGRKFRRDFRISAQNARAQQEVKHNVRVPRVWSSLA